MVRKTKQDTHRPRMGTGEAWRALMPRMAAGEVWLVGAGPGAPELLTLGGLAALSDATHIFYDALIAPDLLKLAHPAAEQVFAGRRVGEPQHLEATMRAIVQLARAGGKIVRLKSGDPYLFGRGAEEAEFLWRAKVPFRLVPGLSAGLGGLAYAGIPLTHRAHNHAVTFVTGHVAPDSPSGRVNWRAVSEGSPVLVIYMGLARAAAIGAELMAAGRAAAEPVALVLNASQPGQEVHVGRLKDLGALAAALPKGATGLIVVGPVVRRAAQLNWFRRLAARGG